MYRIAYPHTGDVFHLPDDGKFELILDRTLHNAKRDPETPITSFCVEMNRDGTCYRAHNLRFEIENTVAGTHVFELKDWVTREIIDSVVIDFHERQGCTDGYAPPTELHAPPPDTVSLVSQFSRFKRHIRYRGRPLSAFKALIASLHL